MKRIDVIKVVENLDTYAVKLKEDLSKIKSNNELANKITTSIYDACKLSYIKHKTREEVPQADNFKNCGSTHFQAIADANLMAYNTYSNTEINSTDASKYVENWVKFERLAVQARNDELNSKINTSWKNMKGDGKKTLGVHRLAR